MLYKVHNSATYFSTKAVIVEARHKVAAMSRRPHIYTYQGYSLGKDG